MATINYFNQLLQSNKKLFSYQDLGQIFDIQINRTLEDVIKNFINQNILTQLEKGKYILTSANVSDFEIAQFLYSPSYISFETALNFHGILAQFPVEITSATTQKTKEKNINDKIYQYSQINPKLFTGYYQQDNSLIAFPEKALFDQFYLIAKKIKNTQYLDEMDYSNINQDKLNTYLDLVNDKLQTAIKNLIKSYL